MQASSKLYTLEMKLYTLEISITKSLTSLCINIFGYTIRNYPNQYLVAKLHFQSIQN